jgi:hypothetical protein
MVRPVIVINTNTNSEVRYPENEEQDTKDEYGFSFAIAEATMKIREPSPGHEMRGYGSMEGMKKGRWKAGSTLRLLREEAARAEKS